MLAFVRVRDLFVISGIVIVLGELGVPFAYIFSIVLALYGIFGPQN